MESDHDPVQMALAYLKDGDPENALNVLDEATESVRSRLDWYLARIEVLYGLGRHAEAKAERRALKQGRTAVAASAWLDKARHFRERGHWALARAAGGRGLWLMPDHAEGLMGICSDALREQRFQWALPFARSLLDRSDGSAKAMAVAGSVFIGVNDRRRAWEAFEKAVAKDANDLRLHARRVGASMEIAEWRSASQSQAVLRSAYNRGEFSRAQENPFRSLAWYINDLWNRRIAEVSWKQVAGDIHPQSQPVLPSSQEDRPLRVGYLSSNWFDHPTLTLAIGVLEQHDPDAVEGIIYCHSPEDDSELRERLKTAVPNNFVDLRSLNDAEAAERIRDDHLDVLVHCAGFTENNRVRILAYRPAPVQVNWLSFPGSMGSEAYDYIIGDPVVTPQGSESDFSEAVCRLPENYQANDHRRPVAARTPTRKEERLPEQGVVFCCFNQAYKIEPVRWATFMAILRDVPDSVLWLLELNPEARENLRNHAQSAGVNPDRLMFAPRRPGPLHLARLANADIALDSRIYNGHTTTADALWMGVPVLTTRGGHFASRVSGSLLRACHLPELVLADEEALHARAVALAKDPKALKELRERVKNHRFQAPLFDTVRYTRHLESAFREMVRRAANGEPPRTLEVTPLPARTVPFAEAAPRADVDVETSPEPVPTSEYDPNQQWAHAGCPVCNHPGQEYLGTVAWTETVTTNDGQPLENGVWCRCTGCGHTYTPHYWAPGHPWAGAALPVQPGPEQSERWIRMLRGGEPRGRREMRSQQRPGIWLEVRPQGLEMALAAAEADYTVAVMEAPEHLVENPAGLKVTAQRFLHTRIDADLSVLSLPGVLACTPFPELYLHRAAGLLPPGAKLLLTVPMVEPGSSVPTAPQSPALLHRLTEKTLHRVLKEAGLIWQESGRVPDVPGLHWVIAKR